MTEHIDKTRRALAIGAGAAGLTLGVPRIAFAATPEITLRYATNVPMTNPANIRLAEAFERIKQQTNGRVEIKLFPDGQLGSDPDMLSQVRSGAIDFFQLSSVILSTLVPAAAISGIGFAFPSYTNVWAAIDGALGDYMKAQITKAGVAPVGRCFDIGFRQMTSSTRAVRTVNDLKGFKVRVPPGPLWISMFKALETSPTTINFSETYSALQTHVVDGTELPLVTISTSKIYEVQKYLSLTRHMWDGTWALANRRMWEKLPEDVRKIISDNLSQSAIAQREDVRKVEGTALIDLKAKGMTIFEVDSQPFRAKLKSAGFYAEWKAKFGDEAWALLERYTGAIS